MIRRFNRIIDELIDVSYDVEGDILIDSSWSFSGKSIKCEKMVSEIIL